MRGAERIRGLETGWRSQPDPLYGRIDLPPAVQRLLALPAVRRLSRLRQLGEIGLSVPSASHTRLSHSLGAMHLAGVMFDRLVQRMLIHEGYWSHAQLPKLNQTDRLAVQIAALLHDIGHGPFSHLFETVIRRRASGAMDSHEARTTRLIMNQSAGINEELARLPGRFNAPLAIAGMIRGRSPILDDPAYEFMGQLISSDFDADRMDFLARDSLHTGIRTGSVDAWSIIDRLTLARDSTGTVRLVLPTHAEDAARQFLEGRRMMYRSLYQSAEALVAHELLVLGFDERFGIDPQEQEMGRLALATDDVLLAEIERDGSVVARDVVRRFRDDDPYLVLPVELGGTIAPLSAPALRKVEKWRRPLSQDDASEHNRAIKGVAQACWGNEVAWRSLLLLERGKGTSRPSSIPWILDSPERTPRPIELDPASPTSRKTIAVAIPPDVLISPSQEAELRSASCWVDAVRLAHERVHACAIARLYGEWLDRLDPKAGPGLDATAIEKHTGEWLARLIWCGL